MKKATIKKKAVLEALEKSLGVVTTACGAVGISRQTFYQWIRTDEDFAAAVDDVENIAIDFAESQLHKQMRNGNAASTIFYLKCKGKARGYIERQEIDLSAQGDITIIEKEFEP